MDNIEIHFYPKRGELSLWCGPELFGRLRDSVLAEPVVADAVGDPKKLRLIEISVVGYGQPAGWIAKVACLLVALGVLFPIVVGVMTILRWFK